MSLMRAKLVVSSVVVGDNSETLRLNAVAKSGSYDESGSDEDNTFSKFTPSANMDMLIMNPDLFGKFRVGQKFYVDFTEVEEQPAETEAEAQA